MSHQPIPGDQPPGDQAEELLAMVAHELRRPLTAMLGALATLQQRIQALSVLQQQELLGMTRRQAEQLQRLLDQLLAAASVDLGHARQVHRSLVDAAALAQEAGYAARLAHPNHPITIEAAGPLLVWVDPLAVSRILGNLLDNAATYSQHGRRSGYRPTETAYTRCWPSRIKGLGSRWPIATGSSSVMCACTVRRPATAVGLGLGCTSPGGWPPLTAVSCSSPTCQVLEAPGLSCVCPWRGRRHAAAAPTDRLRPDQATSAAAVAVPAASPTGLAVVDPLLGRPLGRQRNPCPSSRTST